MRQMLARSLTVTALAALLPLGAAQAGDSNWGATSVTGYYTNLDGDSGAMLQADRRAQGRLGLAISTDVLREDFGPLTHTRYRVGLGPGTQFEAGGLSHYAAVVAGWRTDQFNRGVSNEAGWYSQARYEVRFTPRIEAGMNLTYTDVDNFGESSDFGEGFTAEAVGRFHLTDHLSAQAAYLSDFDDVEGEDRFKIGLRLDTDWL